MSSNGSTVVRVKLIKHPKSGLGFLVRQRTTKPPLVVSDLVSGGIATESGLVHIGDVILRVNDNDLSGLSYDNAIQILKNLPVNAPVVLLLQNPDGYVSYLETKFTENGIPKTIRITKPVVQSDSIMSRIKRTLSGGSSSKSSAVNQNSATANGPQRTCNSQDVNLGANSLESDLNENDSLAIRHTCLRDSETQTNGVNAQYSTMNGVEIPNQHDKGRQSPYKMLTPPLCAGDALNSVTNSKTINSEAIQTGNHVTEKSPSKSKISIKENMSKEGGVKLSSEQIPRSPRSASPNVMKRVLHENYINEKSVNSNENADETGINLTASDEKLKKDLLGGHLRDSRKSKVEERRGSHSMANSPKKFVRLRNVMDEKAVSMDTLHVKSMEQLPCTAERCLGSQMNVGMRKASDEPRSKEELIQHAKDFIEQYYTSIKRQNTPSHQKRTQEVLASIEEKGTYELTSSELTYGAKTAWRNAPRCIGRIQWSKLQVFDARHITTARGMFEAICNHIKYGTNKGNIRSAITIFPPRTDGKHDFRVWSPQFIKYAGYKQSDGSVIGDPAGVEFTEICQKLGWKGKGGMFDILPLVLQANGHDPEMFEIPPDLILEVQIKHPKLPWFADLGLRWYALPAVANILFDCGGLEFTAAPFNGWYMGTEIGARDLCDKGRYNILETVANRMGLDTRKNSSLWKDRALVEINIAVLHSYQSCGVTITDHHAAAESFMKHLENEQRLRGGCPADWVWVVPPMSGSLLPVFHQEMLCYKLKPSYEYQEDPWKSHIWKKDKDRVKSSSDKPRKKIGFRELARAVKFSAKLMGKALARRVKCTIMYATETGKSEGFAKTLCEIFKHAFDAKVVCMDEYDVIDLEHEALVLIVTSTFGNGDPPENGERLGRFVQTQFAKTIFEMKHPENRAVGDRKQMTYIRMSTSSEPDISQLDKYAEDKEKNDDDPFLEDNLTLDSGPLSNVRYSVFGLGSRAYPNFCAFAHYMDNILNDLGGERILKMAEGDELCGQEEAFRIWAKEVFKSACETFCVGDDNTLKDAVGSLSHTDMSWSPGKFRLTPADNNAKTTVEDALSKLHGKTVHACKFLERQQLQAPESTRQTILVKLHTGTAASELQYTPGDHIGIFAENSSRIVDGILARLSNAPPADQLVKVEVVNEKTTPLGTMKTWEPFPKFPVCTVRSALSRFLDITTPPSQTFLKLLASQTNKDCDKEELETLANNIQAYEDWKHDKFPHLLEVLEEFPSLRIPPTLLMTQLPVLQQRYYSISSSSNMYPSEIHATVAVVKYHTQGDVGPLHEGVSSSWLNRIDVGETVPCYVRGAPSFHMPEDNTLPLVLVGPGTGIAPFRSFWQQRKIDKEMLSEPQRGGKKGWGEISLYRGCRQKKLDAIYEEELETAIKEGVLANVYTALSREPDLPKMYVQDVMKKNAASIYKAIGIDGGHFYVCGDVKMASDVSLTLEKILQSEGNMTHQDAKNFVLKLRDSSRFHEDIFGVTLRSSEVTDKARDQAKKAWNYINAAGKSSRLSNGEVVIPTSLSKGDLRGPKGRPKAPKRNVFSLDMGLDNRGNSFVADRDRVPSE